MANELAHKNETRPTTNELLATTNEQLATANELLAHYASQGGQVFDVVVDAGFGVDAFFGF